MKHLLVFVLIFGFLFTGIAIAQERISERPAPEDFEIEPPPQVMDGEEDDPGDSNNILSPARNSLECFPMMVYGDSFNSYLAIFNPIKDSLSTVKVYAVNFDGNLIGESEIEVAEFERVLLSFSEEFFTETTEEGGRFYVLAGSRDTLIYQALVEKNSTEEDTLFVSMNPASVNYIMGAAHFVENEAYETSILLVNTNNNRDVNIKVGINSLAEGADNADEGETSESLLKLKANKGNMGDMDDMDDMDGEYEALAEVEPEGDALAVIRLLPNEAKLVKLSELLDLTGRSTGALVLRSSNIGQIVRGNRPRLFCEIIIYTHKETGKVTVGQLFGAALLPGHMPHLRRPAEPAVEE